MITMRKGVVWYPTYPSQLRSHNRVSTANAKVCALGDGRKFVECVAKRLSYSLTVLEAAFSVVVLSVLAVVVMNTLVSLV